MPAVAAVAAPAAPAVPCEVLRRVRERRMPRTDPLPPSPGFSNGTKSTWVEVRHSQPLSRVRDRRAAAADS